MASTFEYALLAGVSYRSTRAEINRFSAPIGWSEIPNSHRSLNDSGFEAVAFNKGNEIVISFAGTNPNESVIGPDHTADFLLATGVGSVQLEQAAEYYLQIKAANSSATITFTGHSLGGGLAALMGVFFGKQAVTFDQAPFANSAEASLISPDVASNLRSYLVAQLDLNGGRKYSDTALQGLMDFLNMRAAMSMGEIPNSSLVKSINVQGEFLSGVPWNIPDRIGQSSYIPTNVPGVSGDDLHSVALLTTFLQSMQTASSGQTLNSVTTKLTDLVGMIFDSRLYKFSTDTGNTTNPNFLEWLVRNELGNAMVTRFTNDLWKLAQDGGLTMADDSFASVKLVSQTLIAFAMQKYYSETQASAGYNHELFTELGADGTGSGGIRFDLADVAANLTDTKGYNLYFHNYLANAFTASDRDRIESLLPGLRDWYVQAGSGGMNATDTQNHGAFMLGGRGADTLTGGTQTDLLVGNTGFDSLTGGAGTDTLLGGQGFDRYYWATGDGHDRIEDADATGAIFVNGRMLVGGVKKAGHTDWESADGTIKYELSGGDLVVKLNGTQILTVNENFESGEFGIQLIDAKDLSAGLPTSGRTIEGDHVPAWPFRYDDLENSIWDDPTRVPKVDHLQGSGGNDTIDAGELEDWLRGFGGDDVLLGGGGADRMQGGDGHDYLFSDQLVNLAELSSLNTFTGVGTSLEYLNGGAGDDVLVGGAAADELFGASGADLLLGGDGTDFLGGDDNHRLPYPTWPTFFYFDEHGTLVFANLVNDSTKQEIEEFGQADEMYGGGGDDLIWAGGGNDLVYGDAGDDRITGDSGDDTIFGGDGNDWMQGENSALSIGSMNDYLDGGDGDDFVLGAQGDDVVIGGLGSDYLFGEATNLLGVIGNDILDGGDGNDFLYGEGGNDTLFGGAGNDELIGDFTNDPVPGNDLLFGDAGFDHLQGEAGDDMLDGGEDDDELQGGSGNDMLFGGAGNDLLFGEATSFQGQAGDDTLDGGEGTDHLQGGGGADTLFGGTGNDALFGDDPLDVSIAGNDFLDGEEGDDELQGGLGNDTLFGGDGNDALRGDRMALAPNPENGGNDILDGGIGDDELDGDSGNDVLTGGAGQDVLIGGSGQDTYVFNLGDGTDTIVDTVTDGTNRLIFGAGITADQLTYSLGGTTLTIGYNGVTDTVQLEGFHQNTVLGSLVVSTLEFAGGSLVNLADLFVPFTNHAPTLINPLSDVTTAEDALLSVVVPVNTFADQDAGDILSYSASRADGTALPGWLNFDANTRILSGTPDDAQVGSLDLKVTVTDSRLKSVSDTFTLTVTSVNDAPTLAAPISNQFATKDLPFNFVVPQGTFADEDPGDSLAFGATLADGNPLPTWLTFTPSTRTFSGTPQLANVGVLNVRVMATDTGNLSTADVFSLTVAHGLNEIVGTTGNDYLSGTPGNDLIRGFGGDDTLSGLDGDDTLDGGAGNDQLYGGIGTNVLLGGAGADRLEGYTGQDTFQGGPGNDTLYDPYGGQNVYLFDRGDGQDINYSDYGAVRFAAGVLPTDVTVRGNRDGFLTLRIAGTTDQMSLFGWLNPFDTVRIDRVEFTDGTVWNGSILQAMASAGTAGDDYLGGTNGNDVLIGLEGNDYIQAYNGDDVLDGGAGDDTLLGNGGNDTYVFGRGYGVDVILDEVPGSADAIQLAAGILPGDVTLLQNGTQTLLSLDQSATQLSFSGIELIRFNDGTTWDAVAIASHTLVGVINSMTGTAGNDTFIVDHTQDTVTEAANQGTDTIQSLVSYTLPNNVENLTLTGYFNVDGEGNLLDNVIIGNRGNNTLSGGADYWSTGTDTLRGGLGDDRYTVLGDNDLVIEALNEGLDTVTLIGDASRGGWNYTLPANVENLIVGAANQVWSSARSFYGNALDNVIQGDSEWMNYIDGGSGADTMMGGRYADTYVVDNPNDVIIEVGSSTDTVFSTVTMTLSSKLENLTLSGSASINGTGNELNNVLMGNSAANVLTGGAGDDTYIIGAGDTIVELPGQGTDTVSSDWSVTLSADLENVILTGTEAINATGNAADNVLTGNSADNVLDGGAGADQLIGGDGNDTYVVGAGDTIVEQPVQGVDTVITDATFILSSDLENLTLIGMAAINGTGNASDNVLMGNSGVNLLTGGVGDDTYVVGAGDMVVENVNEGTDTVRSDVTWTLEANTENLTLIGAAAINGTGNAANNVLMGNDAANILTGGAGDDLYLVGSGDTIVELVNEGTDIVQSTASFALAPNLEYLTLTGTAAINGMGNAQNNVLTGNSGANVLDGGAGADTMFGDAGDDIYVVDHVGDTVTENASAGTDTVQSSITYTLGPTVENLTLVGTAAINATGNSLNNILAGNSAANVLAGGAGNDTYLVEAGDTVTESASQGTDTVQSAVTWTLGANLEKLTLVGTAAVNGTGNTLNNVLTGNNAANVLNGGTGSDSLAGGAGDDTYVVDATGDTVTENVNEGADTVHSAVTYTLGVNLENLTLTGTSTITGTGNTLDNVLVGNSAANVLTGGAGNDTYVVGTGDAIVENTGAGTDTVQSAITWTLGSNLEHLTLTGTSAINGTGNTLNNVLTGNSAANVLNGGTGADAMSGGAGNDTYVVDNISDTVTEHANEGTDLVQSSATYALSPDVENLTLTGTAAINATGNGLNNVLTGNTGNNVLDGGQGADTMAGGTGNDTYVVDQAGDIVTEATSAGTDTVQSSITYTLGSNLENLTLTGTSAINGTGNTLNNGLTGNSAANVLNGGTGSDSMAGGTGDDTYVVDNTGDTVTETANAGTDLVQSSVTHTLAANVEHLTLTGTSAVNGTGNTLDNLLIGNSVNNTLTGGAGNDTLDGGLGSDTMIGGTGNDIYVVNTTGDLVTENANEGTDTIQSSVTWTLGSNLEQVTLAGTSAINGTGNTLNNVLTGNAANNVLTGLGGNDTYLYSRGGGQDTVVDNAGTSDTLGFGAMITPLDLVLSRQVNDLRLAMHGTTDQVTIQNWYTSPTTNQVETFHAGTGQLLLSTQVEQLIQAMAAFTQQSGLTWDQAIEQRPQEVQAVLAASWQ